MTKIECVFRCAVCMAVVYSLETDGLIWYVGSTVNAKRREQGHRHKHDKGMGAALISDDYEWEFKVLEECPKEQMRERERFWYERLNPFYNKSVPNRGKAERDRKWREAHPEAHRVANRKWQKAHPEAHRAANRRYRARQKQMRESSNTALE